MAISSVLSLVPPRPAVISGSIAVILLTISFAVLLPSPVLPAEPSSAHLERPVEISDSELSGLRGRYVSLGKVLYFGISMVSQWVTDTGEDLRAGLSLGIPLSPKSVKRHTPYSQDTGNKTTQTTLTDVSIRTPLEVSGSGNRNLTDDSRGSSSSPLTYGDTSSLHVVAGHAVDTSGIVQRIHIAGDSNVVKNDISMDIKVRNPGKTGLHDPTRVDAIENTPVKPNGMKTISYDSNKKLTFDRSSEFSRQIDLNNNEIGPVSDPQPPQAPAIESSSPHVYVGTLIPEELSNRTGAKAKTYIEGGKAGISIEIPGIGELKQQVSNANSGSVKGILQQVVLAADRQHIKNSLRLQAVLRGETTRRAPDMRQSLRSLINLQMGR